MRKISNLHMPDSTMVDKILTFVEEKMERLRKRINEYPVTDSNNEVTNELRSRYAGYAEVKYFIGKECR